MPLPPKTVDLLIKVTYTITLVAVTFLVTKVLHKAIEEFAEKGIGKRYSGPVKHFTTAVIIIISLFFLLYIWEVYGVLVGVLAGAGFAGIVVGFAAKDVLSDLLAGVLIFFDQPFNIGDWVEVGGEEGIVGDVSLRSLRIKSFKGEYVVIPNRKVRAEVIKNKTRNERLRIDLDIGIKYEDEPTAAVDVLEDYLDTLDEVKSHNVILKELGDSAVLLQSRLWIDNPTRSRFLDLKTEAYIGMKKALEEEGFTIPYPHLRVLEGDY